MGPTAADGIRLHQICPLLVKIFTSTEVVVVPRVATAVEVFELLGHRYALHTGYQASPRAEDIGLQRHAWGWPRVV